MSLLVQHLYSFLHHSTTDNLWPSRINCSVCKYEMSRSTKSHKSGMRSHGSKTGSGQPEEAHARSATTWPPTSFLFVVNELPVNEDPYEGGAIPRPDEYGRWLPPTSRAGFSPQIPGRMFRWSDASIASANGCQWYNGNGWGPGNIPLTPYRTTSMFWCNEWTQFLTADGDVSTRDMGSSPIPLHRWYPLTFDHDGTLSRVGEAFEGQYLAGTGAHWMRQLGLSSHDPHHAHQSTGLAGNLPTVIGLVAFSCRAANLDAVLLNDRAWRHYDWRGHNRAHGRDEGRGIVVNTYLDPDNLQGSSNDTLYPLEYSGGAILR